MFSNPLFHDFINCNESNVVLSDSYFYDDFYDDFCRHHDIEYYVFIALCTIALLLFALIKSLKTKNQVNRDFLAFMDMLIYVNCILVASLFLESLVSVAVLDCRVYPLVRYGVPVNITISILRFVRGPCWFLKNWLFVILSILWFKSFNASSSFSRSLIRTKLTAGILCFIGVVLTVPLMMVVQGQVCKHDPLGPVKIVNWHVSGSHLTWLDRFETFVRFPAQSILPVILCFCCTLMTVHHIRTLPQDGLHSEATRAVVLLLVMFLVFCLTQAPNVVYRLLLFVNTAFYFNTGWIFFVLVFSDTIWNGVIYILLINEWEFRWTSNSDRQVAATTMVALDTTKRAPGSNEEDADCSENLL